MNASACPLSPQLLEKGIAFVSDGRGGEISADFTGIPVEPFDTTGHRISGSHQARVVTLPPGRPNARIVQGGSAPSVQAFSDLLYARSGHVCLILEVLVVPPVVC